MDICPLCHAENRPASIFCSNCGEKLRHVGEPVVPVTRQAQGKLCPACATLNLADHLHCRECGARLPAVEGEAPLQPAADTPDADQAALPATKLAQFAACSACGTVNPAGHLFCSECGSPLAPKPAETKTAEKEERPPVTPAAADVARIVILRPDGQTDTYPLQREITIGREEGEIRLPDDDFLSARHARISRQGGRYVLSDLNSTNGVFIQVRGATELRPGDYIMVEGQVFKFVV